MKNPNPPTLDEAHIQRLATPATYERGEDCYRRQGILQPTRQGSILSAYCVGTALYQVTAIFQENGAVCHSCTCPYNRGGLCKHRVALLLTWLRQPELFQVLPTLRERLDNYSKPELIDLIEIMLEREPILLSLVGGSFLPRSPIFEALLLPTSQAIVEALQPIVDNAQFFLKAGDPFNAGLLYQHLLGELTRGYDAERQALDYNGELCRFSAILVVELAECLTDQSISESVQNLWVKTLLEAYCKDLEMGGIGYADGVETVLLNTQATQWESILTTLKGLNQSLWVRQKVKQLLGRREKLKQSPLEEQDFDEIFRDYQEKVEKYIAQRNRRSYRKAIEFLQKLKSICDRTPQQSVWDCYVEVLRSRYANLKTLWIEIDASDLQLN